MLVQQAIFSSGRRRGREGFHLLSRSSGLTKHEIRLLVRGLPWCDALSPSDRPATGMCSAPLSDEAVSICRSMRLAERPGGGRVSEHNAAELLTHCLVVPREVFAQFGDNPFAVVRAVGAAGYLLSHQPAGGKLQPIRLAGRAPVVDHILLGNLTRQWGPTALAGLVHQATRHERLIVAGPEGEELIAGLMSLLPIELRQKYSFSVGLRPTLGRSLRLVAVPELNQQIERVARQGRYQVLQTSELAEIEVHDDPWAELIAQALEESDFSRLADEVARPSHVPGIAPRSARPTVAPAAKSARSPLASSAAAESGGAVATLAPPGRPRHDVVHDDPESLEKLERLDDLVYDAIAGREGAFEELSKFWPEVLSTIEGEALVESREQYLRYALGLWNEPSPARIQQPDRAMAALDVLCLLFPE